MKNHRTPSRVCLLLFLSILVLAPRPGFAQEATRPSLPPGWITPPPKGLVAEPALLRKLVSTSESTIGDEREPADGLYVETGNMITGEGWISAGPGYRRHTLDDRMPIDVSAAVNGHIDQVMQKVEGHVSFHTAMSTAFPQPAPGTAPSPGPMKVEADRLRSVLGLSRLSFHAVNHPIAITDVALADGM